MRKFFSILLAVMLTVCFASTVLAISSTPLPEEDDSMVMWKGQLVSPKTLTIEELKELYGYNTLQQSAAALAAMDADASSLVIPEIEKLYGGAIDAAIKKDRNDLLSDVAVAIMEQGTGGSSYQDPGQYAPYESCVHIIEYFVERAKEMGFKDDQIVKVMAPNYTVPPHKRSPRLPGQTDAQYWDGPSLFPFYMYVELGDKSLPEMVFSVQHMDPWEDSNSGSARGDRGGWLNDPYGGVFVTPIHVSNPNRFWTLGGSHQANVIRDPVSMRWVMVGRGGDDDRAPGVAMLYAMKAIKDSGIPLRRRIRTAFGTTEDSTTMFRHPGSTAGTHGRPYFGTTSGFGDMSYYMHQDEMFVAGWTADSGVTPLQWGQALSNANISNITLQWTYQPNSIGLRFPNALTYTHESAPGSVISQANQWGSGAGTSPANFTDGAPTAIPALLYNQARDAYKYKAYYAGVVSGTGNGQSLELVAWLVPPAGSTTANITALLDAANAVKNNYRISWGGWEYPDEKNAREAVQKVPMAGRWENGVDVIRVNTKTGQTYSTAHASADAVQVITRGHVTRFWEKEYFSPRHIMVDFLSKIVVPSGFTAPWQPEMRKLIAFFPFDNFRERRIWNGNTLVGNHLGKKIYTSTLAMYNSFLPTFNTPITADSSYNGVRFDAARGVTHPAEGWTNRYTNATVNYADNTRGRNDENVTRITAGITFNYMATITPDDNVFFNGFQHGELVAPAVRARLTELGLTATVANSANSTGQMYVKTDHDALHKAMKGVNNYYKRFGVPDPGYTGEIKEDRPDFINGGTYSTSFRYTGLLQEGRMIAVGNWGGRGTLHGWNERIEIDGMVDLAKRGARIYLEGAAGVPHTWSIQGAGIVPYTPLNQLPYRGNPEKAKLKYALSNDVIGDIYLQEEIVVKPIVQRLFAEGKIPRDETVEILFARKFWQDNTFTLRVDLTNADGTLRGAGKVYLFLKDMANSTNSADLHAVWRLGDGTYNGVGTAGRVEHTFHNTVPGHWYNQRSGDAQVEASVIALVVTNGESRPFDVDADEDGTIREHIKSELKKESGCNAGFALLALAFLPFIRRRK